MGIDLIKDISKPLPENDPDYHGPIGAIGYGLNEEQQRAIADLWDWQRQSLESERVLGGPIEEYNAFT